MEATARSSERPGGRARAGRAPERTLWVGRPALRLYVLGPTFLAPALFAGALAWHAWKSEMVPPLDAFLPLSADSLRLLNFACAEVIGAAMIGLTLLYLLLSRWSTRYELTSQRIRLSSGILVREIDEIELYRVRDPRLRRGPLQIMAGLGTITVDSSEGSGRVTIGPVPGSVALRERIRDASERSKERMGIQVTA